MNLNKTEEYTYKEFFDKVKSFESEEYKEDRKTYNDSTKGIKQEELEQVSSWLMRQYYNPDKNKSDIWYSETVTKENVLLHISNEKNDFPHTLCGVIEQFKLNKSLRATLNNMYSSGEDNDVDDYYNQGVNRVGEVTLKDIGSSIGNVTPTMVNKITDKAVEKFKRIYGIYNSSLGVKFVKYYDNLVEDIADSFALAFSEEESTDDAIASLIADNIVKQRDLEYLSPKDFIVLDEIFNRAKTIEFSELEDIFINDYKSTKRKILLFHYAISRVINPDDKAGRKKVEEK